jgi:hypothetical protein
MEDLSDRDIYNYDINDARKEYLKYNDLYLEVKKQLIKHIRKSTGRFKIEISRRNRSKISKEDLEKLLKKDGFDCMVFEREIDTFEYDDQLFVIEVSDNWSNNNDNQNDSDSDYLDYLD